MKSVDATASCNSAEFGFWLSAFFSILVASLVFPLTPAQISVLEKTNRYSAQTRSARRRARQYSFEASANKFFNEAKPR
jgi:hypothetical protein